MHQTSGGLIAPHVAPNGSTRLQDAVLDAYGWPHDLANDEILARLLALNLERAAMQEGALAAEGQQLGIEEA